LRRRKVAVPLVGGDGEVGEEDADGEESLVEGLVQLGDLGEEVLADLLAHEATAGRQNNQLGQRVPDVNGLCVPFRGELNAKVEQKRESW
jgi:hypothetical protein